MGTSLCPDFTAAARRFAPTEFLKAGEQAMCNATLSANPALNSNHASGTVTMIIVFKFKLPVAAQWPLQLGV